MRIGVIGLGRMGSGIVQRLQREGHTCVVFDKEPEALAETKRHGAIVSKSLATLVGALSAPRVIWLMIPATEVEQMLQELADRLQPGDIVVDGGNSHYTDDRRRGASLSARDIHYVDVGVCGGEWGALRGYCLMIGGEVSPVASLTPIFRALAPGRSAATPTPGPEAVGGTAQEGYFHCGPAGAGHFVKMVHNAIEYALMSAYAEGFNILARANAGAIDRPVDSETAPLRDPEQFQYDISLAEVAEVWRRGSVIGSWLLDLTAETLAREPDLQHFPGRVCDFAEGRWAARAAIETATPTPVLTAALFERFSSRRGDYFSDRLLSALRSQSAGPCEAGPFAAAFARPAGE
jgi:6-phosphogluconate dehydrogenase